ncbi:MAG TPA: MGMT family protein [Patescibacteria group bacterium]|nr:MGMT family protein [Patescibacteria group bacterium]
MKQSFSQKVYQFTRQIPAGKVAVYGQIAAKLGKPKAARAVGNALHRNPDPKTIPCYRVVSQEGRLAPSFREQRKKLLKDGVKFKDKKHVDLKKHLWERSL